MFKLTHYLGDIEMGKKILIWDADPSLGNAISTILSKNGFQPVSLENPYQLCRAIELERPELSIVEGDWRPGSRIILNGRNFPMVPNGELAVILPLFEDSPSGENKTHGIVLENLRKPFGTQRLLSGIRSALRIKDRIEKTLSPWEECLEVRRLRNEEEILAALKLRYEVYSELGWIEPSSEEIDIDPYDLKSIIFGAFFHHNGTKELVGSIRIIRHREDNPFRRETENIMRSYGIEGAEFEPSTLPALLSFDISREDYGNLSPGFATILSGSGASVSAKIYELSRLVTKPKYRRNRFGIERRLYELVVTDCCTKQPQRNWFVIAVHPLKSSKYARYGFRKINELGVKTYTDIMQPAVLMSWDLQHYLLTPNPFTKTLELNSLIYKVNDSLLNTLQTEHLYPEKMAS